MGTGPVNQAWLNTIPDWHVSMGHGSTTVPEWHVSVGHGSTGPCPIDTCHLEHKSIGHATLGFIRPPGGPCTGNCAYACVCVLRMFMLCAFILCVRVVCSLCVHISVCLRSCCHRGPGGTRRCRACALGGNACDSVLRALCWGRFAEPGWATQRGRVEHPGVGLGSSTGPVLPHNILLKNSLKIVRCCRSSFL